MRREIVLILLGAAVMVPALYAQDGNTPAPTKAPSITEPLPTAAPKTDAPASPPEGDIKLDAYDAVHRGNELLRSGAAADALRLYKHAETLQPDAREIAFAEGLSKYKLGKYDAAREAFQRAWLGEKDALADDALYSEGAAYHAEALAAMDQPEVAIERLENAMQRYQSVLANDPSHEAARDANYKAGAAWRQIKKQMQQQQKKNDSKDDKEKNEDEKNKDNKQDQDKSKDQDQQDKQKNDDQQKQDQNEQDQQDSKQKKDQESQDKKDSDQKQKQDQSESEKKQDNQQQTEQQMRQQKVSQQQAERKLREMMQAQRQRKKDRKKKRAVIPVRPAEKDW